MRVWIAAALSLGLVACVSAQGASTTPSPFSGQPPTPTTAPQNYPVAVDLPAGSYHIDPRHTTALFRIRHEGISWFTARFDTKDATLELNAADPSQSHLTASISGVNTGLVNAQGERGFDHSIDAALGGQPLTFTSTAIERTGQFTAHVTGDLTMNGQTHPAVLNVTFGGGHNDLVRAGAVAIGFEAQGTIDRSQWGVNQWTAFAGNEVQIVITTEFTHG
jgi:polyisoprenoid-binding protein YceI